MYTYTASFSIPLTFSCDRCTLAFSYARVEGEDVVGHSECVLMEGENIGERIDGYLTLLKLAKKSECNKCAHRHILFDGSTSLMMFEHKKRTRSFFYACFDVPIVVCTRMDGRYVRFIPDCEDECVLGVWVSIASLKGHFEDEGGKIVTVVCRAIPTYHDSMIVDERTVFAQEDMKVLLF